MSAHLATLQPSEPFEINGLSVPAVYSQVAHLYPERLFARILFDDGCSVPSLQDVTWKTLLDDVSRLVSVLRGRMPDSRSGVAETDCAARTVGVLATSSYPYYVLLVSLWFLECEPILISTRNSPAAIAHLLSEAHAVALICDSSQISSAHGACGLSESQVSIFSLEELITLADGDEYVGVARPPPPELSPDRVLHYMHTSGSSGHPKLVSRRHKDFVSGVSNRSAQAFAGSPAYAPLPLFHGMGLYASTRWPLGSGVAFTFLTGVPQSYTASTSVSRLLSLHTPPPPPSPQALLRHLSVLPRALVFIAPVLIEGLAHLPSNELAPLQNVQRVFVGGAPMNDAKARQLIGKGVPVVSAYGSSETSLISTLDPRPTDSADEADEWAYIRFRDDRFGIHLPPMDAEGRVRELVVSPTEYNSPVVINHDDPVGFATRDLWVAHPHKQGLWLHIGRKDDVTVLSTGEKTDNKQIEKLLLADPNIARVLVFGVSRPFNGVLLEPSPSAPSSGPDFLARIAPTLRTLNSTVPTHSRILDGMALVTSPDRPFALSDKGSIKVKETLGQYEEDIKGAYEAILHGGLKRADWRNVELKTEEDVLSLVRRIVRDIVRVEYEDEDDFFLRGMDSLHAVQLRAALLQTGRFLPQQTLPNVVYAYPSKARLSRFLSSQLFESTSVSNSDRQAGGRNREQDIEALVVRFTDGLDKLSRNHTSITSDEACDDGKAIVLSGATGSLGAHSLYDLLGRKDVRRVWCLHRAKDGTDPYDQQCQAFDERGLPLRVLEEQRGKLRFVRIDVGTPRLAIDGEIIGEICREATHIIHVAWHLNFNLPLSHFIPHVSGTRALVDLALSSRRPNPPKFVFISSIGAVAHYVASHSNSIPTHEQVPERPFQDPSLPAHSGYAESKYVAERILDAVCKCAGLRCAILRAGQLAGSSGSGYWNPREYVPILFASARMMGCVPGDLPDAYWLPVDVAAKATVDMSLSITGINRDSSRSHAEYYHLSNPTLTPWPVIVDRFLHAMMSSSQTTGDRVHSIRIVPSTEWLAELENLAHNYDSETHNSVTTKVPALQLLQFFNDFAKRGPGAGGDMWVKLETTRALAMAHEIDYGQISQELVKRYVRWMERPKTVKLE
ncbi:acetyl-CoA synthetase-like protein [Coniophora puteana RWD-64-598 SS2]|uniref:Acetyl-CoA synthetase-like protein n=1 Tax=Coniophora puteana (strain RWD-64-598) TaxID=741705 RepID=A0A5M3MCI6_CONPW|nr:acetyl-CoA synthetase-like protein [Coniophora puteana RWD-64-598 SS2]EIW76918.1 acetyl-CoA synthetase-like protein [Coniophora puteana RWD-64-598 SS2]